MMMQPSPMEHGRDFIQDYEKKKEVNFSCSILLGVDFGAVSRGDASSLKVNGSTFPFLFTFPTVPSARLGETQKKHKSKRFEK